MPTVLSSAVITICSPSVGVSVTAVAAAALVGMVLYFAFLALLHEENAHAIVKKLLKKR